MHNTKKNHPINTLHACQIIVNKRMTIQVPAICKSQAFRRPQLWIDTADFILSVKGAPLSSKCIPSLKFSWPTSCLMSPDRCCTPARHNDRTCLLVSHSPRTSVQISCCGASGDLQSLSSDMMWSKMSLLNITYGVIILSLRSYSFYSKNYYYYCFPWWIYTDMPKQQ